MANKKYPLWGNYLENNTIQMNNSNFSMNNFALRGENVIRNNLFDLVNSTIKQNSYGFSCSNLMNNNKFHLKNSQIEQSCVIIIKEKGFKKPQVKVFKRMVKDANRHK